MSSHPSHASPTVPNAPHGAGRQVLRFHRRSQTCVGSAGRCGAIRPRPGRAERNAGSPVSRGPLPNTCRPRMPESPQVGRSVAIVKPDRTAAPRAVGVASDRPCGHLAVGCTGSHRCWPRAARPWSTPKRASSRSAWHRDTQSSPRRRCTRSPPQAAATGPAPQCFHRIGNPRLIMRLARAPRVQSAATPSQEAATPWRADGRRLRDATPVATTSAGRFVGLRPIGPGRTTLLAGLRRLGRSAQPGLINVSSVFRGPVTDRLRRLRWPSPNREGGLKGHSVAVRASIHGRSGAATGACTFGKPPAGPG